MSKILLLEDDLSLANRLSFAFRKEGFTLDVARTIAEADALWGGGKYDLLVLDVSLPDKAYLEELLTVLDLKERRHHLPSQLSGGQQQRAAIGRALFTRPALILADEPTGNLDTKNSREVIALLKEASKKYEQTIIMITHNRSIAQTADRVLRVSDGSFTDFGRCRE